MWFGNVLLIFGIIGVAFSDDCRFGSGNFKGCPYRGKCIPFGKKWYVENGEVLRCVYVENKKRYFLESVTGGFCKDRSGFKGCVYQGMCQEFDSTWKDFRGAELKCKKDEKRGFKIETIKAGPCRNLKNEYIGCLYEDKCYLFDRQWVTKDCQTIECKGNKWSFRNRVLKKGLKNADGSCK
ncbi:uncharacterized protein [Magallana gigas]|uniref:uncharacterized protein isoform X1 n=1 Tax=Magallana gigas TaxID=29159 RepID=UPI00334130A9